MAFYGKESEEKQFMINRNAATNQTDRYPHAPLAEV